jgi:ribonuclease Z
MYEQKLVSYCGDGLPIDPEPVRGTELLIHEATLVEPEDEKYPVHSTLESALTAALAAEAKCLLLCHVSSRYRAAEIEAATQELSRSLGLRIPIWLQHFNRLWQIGERNERPRG